MGTPYVGEIRMFAGSFAPNGWAFCDGSLLSIADNDTLYYLIGTTYGGDGVNNFALPDLRGRLPVHQGTLSGTTYNIGESAGAEAVTLAATQIPAHTHAFLASKSSGTDNQPAGKVLAQSPNVSLYVEASTDSNLAANSVASVGGSQPHENMQPFLCVNFIIALYGVFPSA